MLKSIDQQKIVNIWSVANKLTVLFHIVYLITRVLRIPFLKDISDKINALPLVVSYSCICLHKYNSNQSIRGDVNLYALIYFLSFPPSICLIPFGLNALLAVAKNDLAKLHEKKIIINDLEFGKYQANIYFFILENKGFINKLIIHLEIISFCLMPILMFISNASVPNLLALFNLVKFEYDKNKDFKEIASMYFKNFDYFLKQESPLKAIYLKLRSSLMELFESYNEINQLNKDKTD